MTKDREAGEVAKNRHRSLSTSSSMPLKANTLYLMGSNTGFRCAAECISHRLLMSLVLQLPHQSGLAPTPCPLCNDLSHHLISLWRRTPATREPDIQLFSWLEAWPDSLQYKGMACAFPFFRCLHLEHFQDPYRGQQEVQNKPEGMGTRAVGSKRMHNDRAPKDPAIQTFSEE